MKNVRPNQLKKVIFLTQEEYEEVLSEIYGTEIIVHPDLDGIWYEYSDEAYLNEEDGGVTIEGGLHERLAEYFDVEEVISIHCDDCDYVGIWIAIKE